MPNLHVFGGLTIFLKICEDQTYRLALEAEKKLAMKIDEIWNGKDWTWEKDAIYESKNTVSFECFRCGCKLVLIAR